MDLSAYWYVPTNDSQSWICFQVRASIIMGVETMDLIAIPSSQNTWRRWCCWSENSDSRRVCGIVSEIWGCVFEEDEMDKFPQIRGDGDNVG